MQQSYLPIVVVEDDSDVLSLIASLLRAHHFPAVLTFDDSRLALDFLTNSEAAAVVLDLAMPGVSGLDLLTYLRAEKPHIPAIIVTGEKQLETAIECMKAGAIDYIVKPVELDKLIAGVARAVEMGVNGGNLPAAATSCGFLHQEVPERLRKAAIYMEQHLSQELYLQEVAEQACMSKYHFAREFKRCFGTSPMQYMLKLRIAHATSLLLTRETPVCRVARACGFNDQSEFTKWFKKSMGVTPSRFRDSLALTKATPSPRHGKGNGRPSGAP